VIGLRVSTGMAATLKIGALLPAFALLAQDGSTRPLPDPSGPNLLVFYRGDW
jgi:peroxiredoxin